MTHADAAHRNRLAGETSPYLLQHANNPVDWYPWGPDALTLAQRENKPILLSIGYSACHWCHVMAHESFEDAATAAVMNEQFVNIKVDREERPDLDRIYQLAHQLLIRHGGGWPLTMFLTPRDQRPFFGGTYFPKDARHGMPAFGELLRRVAEFYRTREKDIDDQGAALQQAFESLAAPSAFDAALTLEPSKSARAAFAQDFDGEYGGFSRAPKFAHPTSLEFLLRQWRATATSDAPDLHSLYMATLTLTRMAEGGIYDQLGGGFARYSVDEFWMIPHFEKMLYDNAQLLGVYAVAAAATGDPLFKRIASETADWIIRDLQAPHGGYWSTLDADSQGHEGTFYIWNADEVRRQLDPMTYEAFAKRFGLDRAANFDERWHLHAYRSIDDIANELNIPASEVERHINRARTTLLAERNSRVWPERDEKILTSWNGLAISSMSIAARTLRRADLADSAMRAVDFIRTHLWVDGRLLAVNAKGRSRFPAYLDDYAFLLDGLLELLQTQWRGEDVDFAIALADALLKHFEDATHGGFFFTADDHEALMHRSKSFADESVPAGNAEAAQALARLGWLLGETRYLDAAQRAVRAGWSSLERYPHAHAALLIALEEQLDPPSFIVIRGPESEDWRNELATLYAPQRLVFAIPKGARQLPPALQDKPAPTDTVAFVCRGMTCSEPLRSLAAIASLTHT